MNIVWVSNTEERGEAKLPSDKCYSTPQMKTSVKAMIWRTKNPSPTVFHQAYYTGIALLNTTSQNCMINNIKICTELKKLLTGLQSQFWLCPCRTRADAECFLQISLSNKLLRPGISLNSAIILWTWKRREGRIHLIYRYNTARKTHHTDKRKRKCFAKQHVCAVTDIQHGVLSGGHRQNTFWEKAGIWINHCLDTGRSLATHWKYVHI